MNETKFTPGPWGVRDNDSKAYGHKSDCPFLVHNQAWDIAVVIGDVVELDYNANANLIAAAPDLYDALEQIVNSVETDDLYSNLSAGRAALAKARGEN